jgi:hypothetical protein
LPTEDIVQRHHRVLAWSVRSLSAVLVAVVANLALVNAGATISSNPYSQLPQLSQIQQWLRSGSAKAPLPKALISQLGSLTQSNFQTDPCRQMPSAEPVANGCGFGDLSSSTTVVLYGDSFAEQLIPALAALGTKYHFHVIAYARLGCPFASITISNWLGTVDKGCATFRQNVLAQISTMSPKPALVLLSEFIQLNSPTNHSILLPVSNFVSGVTKTLQAFNAAGLTSRVILGVPEASGLPATCLAKNLSNVSACASPTSTAFLKVHDTEIKAALTKIGVKTVNLSSLFCATVCPVVSGNYFVHSDSVHVNAAYVTATAPGLGTLIACSAVGAPTAWIAANPVFLALLPTLRTPTVQAQCQAANSAPLS